MKQRTSRIYNVFDLGPGDGGKGGVVHKLVKHYDAHTVLKTGGAQGSHGVDTGHQKFAFSQWGCGTFDKVPTFIMNTMVISPDGLLNEAAALRDVGVSDPFSLLTVDQFCLCATPYHGCISRLLELGRGDRPRGTIGTGIGAAYRDALKYPHDSIYGYDLLKQNFALIRERMERVRQRAIDVYKQVSIYGYSAEDNDLLHEEYSLLFDPGFMDYNVERFAEVSKKVAFVDSSHVRDVVLEREGAAIVESSHGVLTDCNVGFTPHTSAIPTLPHHTAAKLRLYGFVGPIENVGVHRAYTVRHGAGPMPTADPSMNDRLLPGSCKHENRWQGKIRVGPLDFVLLRYAKQVAQCEFSVAVSWFDQVVKNGQWEICDKYDSPPSKFFSESGDHIKSYDLTYSASFDTDSYQRELTEVLFNCKPITSSIDLPDSIDDQFELVDKTFRDKLGSPVKLVSFGPTDTDKLVKD